MCEVLHVHLLCVGGVLHVHFVFAWVSSWFSGFTFILTRLADASLQSSVHMRHDTTEQVTVAVGDTEI